jgi:hypothetical protein
VVGVLAAPDGELAPLSALLAPLAGAPGLEAPSAVPAESPSPPQPVSTSRQAKDSADTARRGL